jgi:hypothetical protein
LSDLMCYWKQIMFEIVKRSPRQQIKGTENEHSHNLMRVAYNVSDHHLHHE